MQTIDNEPLFELCNANTLLLIEKQNADFQHRHWAMGISIDLSRHWWLEFTTPIIYDGVSEDYSNNMLNELTIYMTHSTWASCNSAY